MFITECGPEEAFGPEITCASDSYVYVKSKKKKVSQINIFSSVKIKLPKKQEEMKMLKPENGSKLRLLKGLCVLNQWKLSMWLRRQSANY